MMLYAWGANSHGQLGVGSFSELEFPQEVEVLPRNISSITAGAGHTIIRDESGDLWVTGWNNKGQLGLGTTEDKNRFEKVEFNEKFKSASAGWDTSAAITADNRLFVWGSNLQNQLGFSSKQHKLISRPVELKLPSDERPSSITFGLRHAAVLTSNNHIYITGSLKHFKYSNHRIINHNSTEFMLIIPEARITFIASGQNHITTCNDRNSIHAIGDNKFMQCSEIKPDGKVIQLSSGWTHNGFLTDSKELFMYGRNNYGQLGNGSVSDASATPQKCQIHPVDDFQLGAEHGILLSNNDIYTWGWNEHANCGNGSVEDV